MSMIEKEKNIEYNETLIDYYLIGEENDTEEEWLSLFDISDWAYADELFDCNIDITKIIERNP